MIPGLDGVNPVVVGRGVIRVISEHPFKYGNAFLLPGLRIPCIVIPVAQGFGQEDPRLRIAGILLDQLAIDRRRLSVVVVLGGGFRLCGRDVQLLGTSGMTLQPRGLGKRRLRIRPGGAVV
jgi:hypothetical protein